MQEAQDRTQVEFAGPILAALAFIVVLIIIVGLNGKDAPASSPIVDGSARQAAPNEKPKERPAPAVRVILDNTDVAGPVLVFVPALGQLARARRADGSPSGIDRHGLPKGTRAWLLSFEKSEDTPPVVGAYIHVITGDSAGEYGYVSTTDIRQDLPADPKAFLRKASELASILPPESEPAADSSPTHSRR